MQSQQLPPPIPAGVAGWALGAVDLYQNNKQQRLGNIPAKRFFPNNLHHKTQILLFGSDLEK